jgi:CrcB protein
VNWLLVAAGGALGSIARYALSSAATAAFGAAFPWGTLLANVSGCLLIGAVAGWSGPHGPLVASPLARNLVMIGFCGGYTTFSAFGLQTLELVQAGDVARAGANVFVSLAACLFAVWLGYAAAAALSR